ncbi:Hypothetical protein A7982_07088 [Minicystis rosea]|nr:Hypothetical protein A7982_07088 [Minicystis rosea]
MGAPQTTIEAGSLTMRAAIVTCPCRIFGCHGERGARRQPRRGAMSRGPMRSPAIDAR